MPEPAHRRESGIRCGFAQELTKPPMRISQGCVGAVKRVLTKLDGVESVDVDLKQQKVTVKGSADPNVVKETVAKTGKATQFWA